MATMLMNMDKGGESEVILGQGRTTSSVLGSEGWFKAERGVRQGSVGGPIKWIVYMNFWLKYVNKKHKEEGYRMSQDKTAVMRSQMFVDDSNWGTRSVQGMSEMIGSSSEFVEFHGLSFNKKKCGYVVMNQKLNTEGEWDRPTWPNGQEIVETIRAIGTQEGRRVTGRTALKQQADRVLHGTIWNLQEETIRSQPQGHWVKIQQEIDKEAANWMKESEEKW